MLTLLLGRARSGKSTSILNRVKQNGKNRPQILLVPEQSSYEAERRLCDNNGNAVSLYAEVFSFTSLAHRVAALFGGLAVPLLDDGGRLLLMYAAIKAVRGNLSIFGPASQKPEFLNRLISTIDELKSYCVSPNTLNEIAEGTTGLTAKKLQDLALIYGTYDAMIAKGLTDPRDRLSKLAETLHTYSFAQGKDCYIDGFTDFTPQEEQVIQQLILQGHSVTVALTCDELQKDDDTGIFSIARHTAFMLLKLAKKNHIPVNIETMNKVECNAVFSHLEQSLFSKTPIPYKENMDGVISVVPAANRREEVAWTAGKIRELLQSGQARYRDIAVTARNIEPYRDLIESIFARYQIPVFQSAMQSILQKPIFTLVTSALDIITGNFSYEDVFRYLKTGLTNISMEECDELENYVLLWNIRGTQWTSDKGFLWHPRGYQNQLEEQDIQQLQHLNHIRCKVISPFDIFFENEKNNIETTKSKVLLLYEFLENISLPDILKTRSNELLLRGEPELATEYEQLWDIFCNALEQCVDLMGDIPIEWEEFSRLLRLLFSQYTVGSIPVSLDRVITGDIPRLSNRQIKTMFILGADDSSIPQVSPIQGLFSEEDRELLSEYGIQLAPGIEAQMNREMTLIYTACTQPSQHLFVLWPAIGEGGGEKYPSFLIDKLKTIFPQSILEQHVDPIVSNNPTTLQVMAMEYPQLYQRMKASSQYSDFLLRLENAAEWKRGRLSRQSVEELYGKNISFSPSRLDKYKSCRFAYYMQYGLKAKPRKSAGFHAPEYGSFVHYVLEFVLREGKKQIGIFQLSKHQIESLTEEAIQKYSNEMLGGLEKQTPRFRYLFLRLQRMITTVIHNVVEELKNSEFEPLFFELGFGHGKELPPVEITEDGVTLSISGFVDRVDGWIKDNRLYLKVVDYKTGRKSFDLTDIWNGLGLQMLLYLFALEDHGHVLGEYEVIPAGVLYLPAKDAMISGSRGMEKEHRRKLIEKELTRKGLILNEPAVIEALEANADSGVRFLPIRVSKKTGKMSGDALVSAENFGRLKKHIQRILKDICVELTQGEITADPYWRSPNQNACRYCDFFTACHFEEDLGEDYRRWIPSIKNSEFWSFLEEQENGGGTDGV